MMRQAQLEVIKKNIAKYTQLTLEKLDDTDLNMDGLVYYDILRSQCSDMSKAWVICQVIEMDVYEIYVAGLFVN